MEQDWKVVVFGKPKKIVKPTPPRKVENIELVERRYYEEEFAKQVQAYRVEQKLSQKQLANKIACREDIIRNLEAGRGIYNAAIITALKRILL